MTLTALAPAPRSRTVSALRGEPRDPAALRLPFPAGARVEAHPHRPRVKAGAMCALSVRELPSGAVVYLNRLVLSEARFVVQAAGQARAEREHVRNVHAWVRGPVVSYSTSEQAGEGRWHFAHFGEGEWVRVVYNPFASDRFHESVTDPSTGARTLGPSVVAARLVAMRGAECWALDPQYG